MPPRLRHVLALAATAVLGATAAHADRDWEASAAAPGRDTWKPGPATWCAGHVRVTDEHHPAPVDTIRRSIESTGFNGRGLATLAALACEAPDDAALQAQVGKHVQRWINLTGINARTARAHLALYRGYYGADGGTDGWTAARDEQCGKPWLTLPESDDSSPITTAGTARQRALVLPWRIALGCDTDGTLFAATRAPIDFDEVVGWNDRLAAPRSELTRVGLVLHCLERSRFVPDLDDKATVVAFARCGADGRHLDRAALDATLAAGDFTPFGKAQAVEAFGRARVLIETLTAAVRDRATSDPALATVLLDAPDAGWAAWVKAYQANQAAVDGAHAYEAATFAGSKAARRGCGDARRAAWSALVAARPPADAAAAAALGQVDSVGQPLLTALIACDLADQRWLDAASRWSLLDERIRPTPGPRAASAWAAFDAVVAARADRDSWVLDVEDLRQPADPWLAFLDNGWANQLSYDEPATAEIKALKPGDDGVLVTFKKVTVVRQLTACESTGQLWGFDGNGAAIYHQRCKPAGRQKETVTTDPVLVPSYLADQLAPGQVATFGVDRGRDAPFAVRHGFPLEVWRDKQQQRLVLWRGVPIGK